MAWGAPSPSPAVASASFLSTKLLATFLLASASSPSSATCAFPTTKPAPKAAAAAGAASQTSGVSSFNRSISFSTPSDRFGPRASSRGSSTFLGSSRLRSEEAPPPPTISLRANSQRQRVVAMATNDAAPASIPKVEKSDAEWRTILSPEQFRILRQKGTEWAGTGKYDKFYEDGVYECAACGTALYKSTSKFKSGCGWPAFFEGLPGAITETPDADGRRVEITCTACGGHLGHNFRGEGFPTPTDERHCVNSISLKFTPADK